MDTTTNKINNNFNLWSPSMKQERTINKVKREGVIKTVPEQIINKDGKVEIVNRVIYSYYSGIRDGVSLNGNDTGTMMTTIQSEVA